MAEEKYRRTSRKHVAKRVKPHVSDVVAVDPDEQQIVKSSGMPKGALITLILLGMALGMTFTSFPLVGQYASGIQSTNLYSGFAILQGKVPYQQFFGGEGPLFYLINGLGNLTGDTAGLWSLEVLALILSAYRAYRLSKCISHQDNLSLWLAVTFELLVVGLLQGGSLAVEFVLPLVLWGCEFVYNYYTASVKDEQFILFGVLSAIAIGLSGLASLLVIVAFLAVLVENGRKRLVARGIYQFLAAVFGSLIVFYMMGFYGLKLQNLYDMINQMFWIPVQSVAANMSLLVHVVYGLLFLLFSGLCLAYVHGLKAGKNPKTVGLIVASSLMLLIMVMSQGFVIGHLVLLLPFNLILVSQYLSKKTVDLSRFIRHQGYVLAFALILLVVGLVDRFAIKAEHYREEAQIARYLKANSTGDSRVLEVSKYLNLYRLIGTASDLAYPPSYYPKAYQDNWQNGLDGENIDYLVVDKMLADTAVDKKIQSGYESISIDGVSDFKIYQKQG